MIGTLGLILPAVIAGFTLLLGPIGLIGLAIAGFIVVVRNLIEVFKILRDDSGFVWAGIKEMFKEGVNFLIGLAEAWANSWVKAVNIIIRALNRIKFTIPDWVPGIGGKSFGISIPTVPEVKLPRFEHGGIVPGAVGESVPIMAHGQERIIPAHMTQGGDQPMVLNFNFYDMVAGDDGIRRLITTVMSEINRGTTLRQVAGT